MYNRSGGRYDEVRNLQARTYRPGHGRKLRAELLQTVCCPPGEVERPVPHAWVQPSYITEKSGQSGH